MATTPGSRRHRVAPGEAAGAQPARVSWDLPTGREPRSTDRRGPKPPTKKYAVGGKKDSADNQRKKRSE